MMISYPKAQRNARDAYQSKQTAETCVLSQAIGRVCAQDIMASFAVQPFNNAAMDGYVVRSQDLLEAASSNRIFLPVTGSIAAGDMDIKNTGPQKACVRIMTGAPVPEGYDAIVPFEEAKMHNDGTVLFSNPVKPGAHIRRAGEDFQRGNKVLSKGEIVKSQHVLPLATLGIATLEVWKKPRIGFLATGKELVDDLSQPLRIGQIYNSNRAYAVPMLESFGAEVIHAETIADDSQHFRRALEGLLSVAPDFIVSSGAVSAGDHDFVRNVLEEMGAEIIHHKVKMRPGKPNLLARLPTGAVYFGLPGNPVATAVGLRFFVLPALKAFLGQEPEMPLRVKIAEPFRKKPCLHMLLKGKTGIDEKGCIFVVPTEGQESFRVSPFINMNCWISIPEEVEDVVIGNLVDVYPLRPHASDIFDSLRVC